MELDEALASHTNLPLDVVRQHLYSDHLNTYRKYKIKQSNKYRQIEEPNEELKLLQQAFLSLYGNKFHSLECCTATIGSNTLKNAEAHKNAKHLLKVDIAHCYQNISDYHYLTGAIAQIRDDILMQVKPLLMVCGKYGYYLPTGAPTSPLICNIVLHPVDKEIMYHLNTYYPGKYKYTRYLDDLIFSTEQDRDWKLIIDVKNILYKFRLHTNKKTRWYSSGQDEMIVTGINIHNQISVPREIRKTLRTKLFLLAKSNLPLDEETKGLLSYVNSIDSKLRDKMINYYETKSKRSAPETSV